MHILVTQWVSEILIIMRNVHHANYLFAWLRDSRNGNLSNDSSVHIIVMDLSDADFVSEALSCDDGEHPSDATTPFVLPSVCSDVEDRLRFVTVLWPLVPMLLRTSLRIQLFGR